MHNILILLKKQIFTLEIHRKWFFKLYKSIEYVIIGMQQMITIKLE